MKITKENYEQYFIDYLDSHLSDREIKILEDFLLLHPLLKKELEGLEKLHLRPIRENFSNKELLKRPDLTLSINEENFEDFCIAAAEGDLNENLEFEFRKYCESNPEKVKDYMLYRHLHLVPDSSLEFTLKQELKKPYPFLNRKFVYSSVSIAAAVMLFFIIYKSPEVTNRQPDNLVNKEITANQKYPIENFTEDNKIIVAEKHLPEINKVKINGIKPQSKLWTIYSGASPGELNQIFSSAEAEREGGLKQVTSAVSSGKKDLAVLDNKTLNTEENMYSEFSQILNSSMEINIPISIIEELVMPELKPEKINENNLLQEKYLSLQEFAKKELTEKVLGKKVNDVKKLTVWDITEAGIDKINLITGSDMKIEKKTTPDGKINKVVFDSRLLSFSTKVNTVE